MNAQLITQAMQNCTGSLTKAGEEFAQFVTNGLKKDVVADLQSAAKTVKSKYTLAADVLSKETEKGTQAVLDKLIGLNVKKYMTTEDKALEKELAKVANSKTFKDLHAKNKLSKQLAAMGMDTQAVLDKLIGLNVKKYVTAEDESLAKELEKLINSDAFKMLYSETKLAEQCALFSKNIKIV